MKSPIDFHCHSTYSLLDGFGTPEDVAKRAVELGWSAACLTEHGWVGSAPAFYQACRAHGSGPSSDAETSFPMKTWVSAEKNSGEISPPDCDSSERGGLSQPRGLDFLL
jgi:DNA polymerase III alpha subunit